jgi:hypothetical protein
VISGPLVNAQVTYFLGIDGTGFFGQNSIRASWTGLRTLYQYSSDNAADVPKILKALDVASLYFKRNAIETATVAKGFPADGYGYLGVCNDSTVLLEKLYRGTDTSYPLVRSKSLSTNPAVMQINDGLGSTIDLLPHDGDNIPDISTVAGRHKTLKRIAWMIPYSLDDSRMVDDDLRQQYKELLMENPALSGNLASP